MEYGRSARLLYIPDEKFPIPPRPYSASSLWRRVPDHGIHLIIDMLDCNVRRLLLIMLLNRPE